MKAYLLIEREKKIEPFGEHPRACLIGNKKLCDHQREVLLGLGNDFKVVHEFPEPNHEEEYLVFGGTLYFTPEFLAQFIEKARKLRTPGVCMLKKESVTAMRLGFNLQDVGDAEEYIVLNLWHFPQGDKAAGKPQPVLMECDQFDCRISVPYHMCGDVKGYAVPMTDTFAVQINHWVNLWAVNVLFALANIARIRKMSKWKAGFWKVRNNLNRIGTSCKIHKTACVEACILGDNVTVEAGAIVRASIIGDNVHIGNGVVAEESILGAGCKILHGHILFSVFYPGTFSVTGFVSASLVGKNAFLGSNVTLTDFRFDRKNVFADKDGTMFDSGNLFLGACLGHGVYLGSGCIVAPGRAVPNSLRLTTPKDRVFCKYDQDCEGFRTVDYKT